ncbi:MAG: 3-oxoacyl-ACP reductase FabG [Spirochaetaceae bacterium]|jgi:3-oxoacyl-[acyl-carrier protein] reductase|nr:3-oxoacyl-ACP reductase FabG [Spirochaetaceae bacterium]
MGNLAGRYAVVTGGAKGIGRKVAERFLRDGCAGIAILDYDRETAEKTSAELGSLVIPVHCDVSSKEMVEKAFQTVYEKFPRVDILVNNAGLTRDAMLHKMSLEQWLTVINADLTGIFLCMQQVVKAMREQCYGKIVNVSSTSAYGNPGQANYSAAKAGILGLTATTAKELGRRNITVNAVAPGFIDTDIIKTVPPETLEQWKQNIPMQRLGRPEEIADVIAFLSSDQSSYVTGCCIPCCGGGIIEF